MPTAPQFSPEELHMLNNLLNELSEIQSNAGCNDLKLDATPQTIAFMNTFNKQTRPDLQLEKQGSSIYGLDLAVTSYFQQRIREMLNPR